RACIEARDAARLREYSMKCLNLMYGWSTRLKGHNTSIALVQGRALGGGFEMVLSTDYVIAEERSSFGFPEIMFGLFPCTGAMGLLSNKIGAKQAERMMTNKRIYSASELYDMGLIDELCSDGEGELAVERYIDVHSRRQKAFLKVQQSRYRTAPLNYEEGVIVVDDWVETAMNLSADELRTMEILMLLQKNEPGNLRQLAA
ncbi:MAG: crotonase/enoyl-CoA hydratase family protein, partial [Gammaproteobacteria bacterium]